MMVMTRKYGGLRLGQSGAMIGKRGHLNDGPFRFLLRTFLVAELLDHLYVAFVRLKSSR
jgi:hypothetical protein